MSFSVFFNQVSANLHLKRHHTEQQKRQVVRLIIKFLFYSALLYNTRLNLLSYDFLASVKQSSVFYL